MASLLAILTPFLFSMKFTPFVQDLLTKAYIQLLVYLALALTFFGAGKTSSQKIMSYEGGKEMVMQEICF